MLFFECVEVRLRDAEGDGLSNGLKTLMIQAVGKIIGGYFADNQSGRPKPGSIQAASRIFACKKAWNPTYRPSVKLIQTVTLTANRMWRQK